MRAVDDAVLSLLRGAGITVYDGSPTPDASGSTVSYPVPYAVYYSNVGDDWNRRLTGRNARRSVFFQLTYVGEDRNQAKWLGEKIRTLLGDERVAITGYKSWLCELQESQRVRRDDDAIRPDGSPLFYGVDTYDISIALKS